MSKRSKLYDKILTGVTNNVRFDDFINLALAFGFVLARVRGSHHILKHPRIPEVRLNFQSENGQAKPYQIEQFLQIIKEYGLELV